MRSCPTHSGCKPRLPAICQSLSMDFAENPVARSLQFPAPSCRGRAPAARGHRPPKRQRHGPRRPRPAQARQAEAMRPAATSCPTVSWQNPDFLVWLPSQSSPMEPYVLSEFHHAASIKLASGCAPMEPVSMVPGTAVQEWACRELCISIHCSKLATNEPSVRSPPDRETEQTEHQSL